MEDTATETTTKLSPLYCHRYVYTASKYVR